MSPSSDLGARGEAVSTVVGDGAGERSALPQEAAARGREATVPGRAHDPFSDTRAREELSATARDGGSYTRVLEVARDYRKRMGRCVGSTPLGPRCLVLVRPVVERGAWAGYAPVECEARS